MDGLRVTQAGHRPVEICHSSSASPPFHFLILQNYKVTDNSTYFSKFNMPFKLPQVRCTVQDTNPIYSKRIFTSFQIIMLILNTIPRGFYEDKIRNQRMVRHAFTLPTV